MSKQLIRFDWAVKKLLRNKANFAVLEGFLSELLRDDIRIEKILESESNQEIEGDKYNRVDILTQNSKNELIIVEIHNAYEIDYFQRMAYGAAKLLAENLTLGQKYAEVKKIISINIVYFDLGQGEDYIYLGDTVFHGLRKQDVLALSDKQKQVFIKKTVSDIFPEYYLIKVNQFNDVATDGLDEWIYFLKNSEVRDDFKAKGLKEAGQVLDMMRLEPDDRHSYNRYLDSLHVKASEMFSLQLEAEDRITLAETTRVAKNALLKGFDDALVAELTQLSIAKIKEIRESLSK